MRPHWLQHDVPARCPLCGAEGAKNALLSVASVLPGKPPVTLLRCPACGVAFLADQTPPDYEVAADGMLEYYVEQGAGIDLVVAPLLRIPPGTVRRCLEIGGSVGFALDFGRWAFGWEVLGIDPSPLAAAGGEALGLPVRRAYFSADLDLGPEPFDLAICSEVLEHLTEPHALLAAIHDRLSPEGLLVLSTPDLALVRPEAEEEALARALSPGFHMMLYDRGALVRVLQEAGFAAVEVEESAETPSETLRAFAARSPGALARLLPANPEAARGVVRDYFADRAASAPAASCFASGFAYRHFKECVNAGLYREAEESRARLAAVYRERHGRDLLDPEREAPVTAGMDGSRGLPFNLPGALYFSGILELNGLDRPLPAASAFAGAQRIGERLRERMPIGLRDGETEALLAQSRKHLPMALALVEPDAAVREIERLAAAAEGKNLPPALLDEARAQTFIRLVNAGSYAAAERLAAGVARSIGSSEGEMNAEALDSLYCLGMLTLHQGRAGEAAELFARVQRLLGEEGERSPMHWLARLHEGLSLWRDGRGAAARIALTEVAGAPVSAPVAEAAQAFLAAVRG